MTRMITVRRCAQFAIVALPIIVVALVARRAVDVPFWDEWEWADLIYKMHLGTLQFADLWSQHSEHRMLVPNSIVIALAKFGGWHPVREQFFSLAVLVVSQLAVVAMMVRTARSTAGVFAALAASLLLFGVWQYENLGWGFQIAWFVCNVCAIGVAFLLARPDRRGVHLFAAIAVAVIGSYSSSQGLVIWAVGTVALLLTGRRGVLALGIWIPAALVTAYLYRHGLVPVETGHVNIVAHPLLAARYIFAYLGSPVAGWLGANGSLVAGVLGVAAVFAAFIDDIRSPFRSRRLARAACWYALAVYPLLCALGTSTGRAGFGIDQALASRYTTITGLLWIALVGLAASRFHGARAQLDRPRYEGLILAGIVFGFFIGASDFAGSKEWAGHTDVLRTARIELSESNPAALIKLYPVPAREIMLINELNEVRDGIFSAY